MAEVGGTEIDEVHRMNEGNGAWGALKSMLSNRGFGFNVKSVCMREKLFQRHCLGLRHLV